MTAMTSEQSVAAGVKERPILMAGRLVRATLDGRKTQTRRPIRGVPPEAEGPYEAAMAPGSGANWGHWSMRIPGKGLVRQRPPGVIGDVLWVRENFAVLTGAGHRHVYQADGPPTQAHFPGEQIQRVKWTPSIHMPRRACRLRLLITDVRVERIQDISEEDAKAEGAECRPAGTDEDGAWYDAETPRQALRRTWDTIYSGAQSWGSNPWCWAISYEVVR